MKFDKRLIERWRTPDGESLAGRVLARLKLAEPLQGLGLLVVEGRFDLRGFRVPIPIRENRSMIDGLLVDELGGLLELNGRSIDDIDFSGATLDSLRWTECKVRNCRFDGARCQDWRLWATEFAECSFDDADLRRSALGPWRNGQGNVFRGVTFRRADLRGATSTAASYIDCDFSGAKIVNIDFQSSGFTRCRFAGQLRKVIFWDHGFDTGKPDSNTMEDVDFTEAHFREVEFRRLSLDRVRMPQSEEHLIVHNYRCVLERAIVALEGDPRRDARALAGFLKVHLRWALADQTIGVFAVPDFDGLVDRGFLFDVIRRSELECGQ